MSEYSERATERKEKEKEEIESKNDSLGTLNQMEEYLKTIRIFEEKPENLTDREIETPLEKIAWEIPIKPASEIKTDSETQLESNIDEETEVTIDIPKTPDIKIIDDSILSVEPNEELESIIEDPLTLLSTEDQNDISVPKFEVEKKEDLVQDAEKFRLLPRSILIDNSQKSKEEPPKQIRIIPIPVSEIKGQRSTHKNNDETPLKIIPIPLSDNNEKLGKQEEKQLKIIPIPRENAITPENVSKFEESASKEENIRIISMDVLKSDPNQKENVAEPKENDKYEKIKETWQEKKKNLTVKWQKAKVEMKKKLEDLEVQFKSGSKTDHPYGFNEKDSRKSGGMVCSFCGNMIDSEIVRQVFAGNLMVCEYCGLELTPSEIKREE